MSILHGLKSKKYERIAIVYSSKEEESMWVKFFSAYLFKRGGSLCL